MYKLYLIIIIIAIIVFIIKTEIEKHKAATNKNKSLNDLSYQQYSKFFGEVAKSDENFEEKINKIYELIVNKKYDDIDNIANLAGCTYHECEMKIKYLKNKRMIGDYYIDSFTHKIKLCDTHDKKLLAKYSRFIYKKHMNIDEIVVQLTDTTMQNKERKREQVIEELKYLIDKSLINGVAINEIDGKLIYYSLVKKDKKEHNIVPIDCPHCGSYNEVSRGSKVRCEYCNAIIEAPLE